VESDVCTTRQSYLGRYKAALKDQKGEKDQALNLGFKMRNGQMTTYNQEKLRLTAYKRRM